MASINKLENGQKFSMKIIKKLINTYNKIWRMMIIRRKSRRKEKKKKNKNKNKKKKKNIKNNKINNCYSYSF